MPFGIPLAPEYYQRKLDHSLEDLNGIYKITDDILITGRGASIDEAVKDHDANLLKVLDRHRERNLKLKQEKLQLKCSEMPFISEPQLAEIQQETVAEPVLQSLTQVIIKGWPEKKDDLLIELHPYFDVRDELTAQGGVLFKGLQYLILSSLRPKIHECLHGAHSGNKKKVRFCASYKK